MESWRAFANEEHATDAAADNVLYKRLGGPSGRELIGLTTPQDEFLSPGMMLQAVIGAGYPANGDIDAVRAKERELGQSMKDWDPEVLEGYGFNTEQIAQEYTDWVGATLQSAEGSDGPGYDPDEPDVEPTYGDADNEGQLRKPRFS